MPGSAVRPLHLSKPASLDFLQEAREQEIATEKPFVLTIDFDPPKTRKMIKYESSKLCYLVGTQCGNGVL